MLAYKRKEIKSIDLNKQQEKGKGTKTTKRTKDKRRKTPKGSKT
jgi:hypothetical protein